MSTPRVTEEQEQEQDQHPDGVTSPSHVQCIESGVVAALAVVAVLVLYPGWWWVILAAFLVFDLSALGYLRSPAAAISYNAVHNYAWPAVAAALALVTATVSPTVSTWAGLVACAWAFHVGFDRAIGAGLKLPDAFAHTHLGWVGKRGQAR